MNKYTPAPWTMEHNEGYLINGIIHVPDVYEEHHADARLIAAAPQLLEALDKACNELLEISHPNRCRYCGAVRTWTGDGTIPHPTWHQPNCVIAVAKSALVAARGEA